MYLNYANGFLLVVFLRIKTGRCQAIPKLPPMTTSYLAEGQGS